MAPQHAFLLLNFLLYLTFSAAMIKRSFLNLFQKKVGAKTQFCTYPLVVDVPLVPPTPTPLSTCTCIYCAYRPILVTTLLTISHIYYFNSHFFSPFFCTVRFICHSRFVIKYPFMYCIHSSINKQYLTPDGVNTTFIKIIDLRHLSTSFNDQTQLV